MSQIASGAIPITFQADRRAVDEFLAELRKGYTVPIRPEMSGGGSRGSIGPADAWQRFRANGGVTQYPSGGSNGNGNGYGYGGGSSVGAVNKDLSELRTQLQLLTRELRGSRIGNGPSSRGPMASNDPNDGDFGTRTGATPRLLRAGRLGRLVTGGYIAAEALGVAQKYQEYQNASVMARNPMEQFKAEMGLAQAIQGVPVVGQAAAIVGNRWILGARLAERGAEEGQRDLTALAERQAQSRQIDRGIHAAEYETSDLATHASVPRALKAIAYQRFLRQEDFTNSQRELLDKANLQQLPEERNRLVREYNQNQRRHPELEQKQFELDQQKVGNILFEQQKVSERRARLAAGDSPDAEGRFGIGQSRRFRAGLLQEEADAGLVSDNYRRQVASENILKQAGENERVGLETSRRQRQTESIAYELARDPLNARLSRIQGEGDYASHFARAIIDPLTGRSDEGKADLDSIKRNTDAQKQLATQDYNRQTTVGLTAQNARNEELGIATNLNDGGTPAQRELRAQIDTIKRNVELQALGIFETDEGLGNKAAPGLYRGAQLQLQKLQQDYLGSFKAEEIQSIQRTALTGPGTEDPAKALADIAKTIDDLKNVPKTLTDILNALGNLVAQ